MIKRPAICMKLVTTFFYLYLSISGMAQGIQGSWGRTTTLYERCSPFSEEIRNLTYETVWRGERISKVLVLWTEQQEVEDLDLQCSDFISAHGDIIHAKRAVIRSMKYVRSDLKSLPCGEYADRDPREFIELGDILHTTIQSSLSPLCPNTYWFTLDIPSDTRPGTYQGSIQVSADQQLNLEFYLSLQVVEFTIPPVDQWNFHLDLWQYPCAVMDRYNAAHQDQPLDYWSEEHFSLLKRQYSVLAATGQKVITAHIKEGALGSPSMVRWIRNVEDSWTYDFTAFDQYVETLLALGINGQISCQSPVGWNSGVIPYWCESEKLIKELPVRVGSEIYAIRWNHFLDAFRLHLTEKGWFSKAVLYLDEIAPDQLQWIVDMIKNNHPEWKIGMAGFHPLADSLAAHFVDISMMVGTLDKRCNSTLASRSTFYTSCNPVRPNTFIAWDSDLADNIWMGWHALHLGMDGYLRWAFDYWTSVDPVEQRIGSFASGDFSLSYRSSNELDMQFFSSVRLELLREGIEDFEKISLLRKRLKGSQHLSDQEDYCRLMSMLDEFDYTSGESSKTGELVHRARKLLDEIVTKSK